MRTFEQSQTEIHARSETIGQMRMVFQSLRKHACSIYPLAQGWFKPATIRRLPHLKIWTNLTIISINFHPHPIHEHLPPQKGTCASYIPYLCFTAARGAPFVKQIATVRIATAQIWLITYESQCVAAMCSKWIRSDYL